MDWNYESERHGGMLQRIVALLFALADLADRASARSFRVRYEVMFILSHDEDVAREFIIEEAQWSGIPILYLPTAAYDGGSVDDAVQLAIRLRALAAILAYICAQTLPSKRRSPRYFLPPGLSCPANTTCQILPTRRSVGFRALDSPELTAEAQKNANS